MKLTDRLRAAMNEPLVHFLLAGLAVFLFFSWRGTDVDPASRTITISQDQVQRLALNWAQTWQRPPTQTEIDGLIREYIKDEIYMREALRLGLDRDDNVIRRRLRSKMEFLETSQAENMTPDDTTLQAWLNRNVAKYASGAKTSFDQIYIDAPDVSAARVKQAVMLRELNGGADWRKVGDPISLPASLTDATKADVARAFGDEFAAALSARQKGGWAGPVASGFGFHLVRVRGIEITAKPSLDDVRQQVENDWRSATIRTREAKSYQALLDGYVIQIEKP